MDLLRITKFTLIIWIIVIYKRFCYACVFHSQDGLGTEAEGVRFVRVREDLSIGKEILLLRAYPRTTILIRGMDRSTDHKFFRLNEINSTTVQILLDKSLEDLVDRDIPQNLLKFRIFCSGHNGRNEEAAYMSVTVYIEDINDHSPVFLNEPYIVNVDESTGPGSIIYQNIQVFDRDKPNTPNSDVQITIVEMDRTSGASYFGLESPHRPYLILKRALDYDNGIREFNVPLLASDRGTPARYSNTTLTVYVRDTDDLPPKFTEGVYRTKINEFYPMTGKPIRIPLYFEPPIMAFDQDSLNASLIYDIISGNERKLFRVNPLNGIIYLEREIDLEEESLPGNTFVLQIEARQKDSPLKRALARIEIEVIDLNDNSPEFEVELYNISIVENLPSGFSVLQVNAIDRDQGENAEFFYNLAEEKPSGAFLIDARTGWITVRDHTLLDREERTSIAMLVQAVERNHPYDVDRPKDSGQVQVEITLLDSNDNTPQFEQGNLYEFKVNVNAETDTVVGKVSATDPDEGRNGMILYELQRPKGSGYIPFRLDPQTGILYVSGPLRRGRVALFIEASDQPTNPSERRFSLAVITIEVHSVINEDNIDFVAAPYEFWVGAEVPVGTSVGQVRTTLDYDGEGDIMYDLLHSYSEGVPFAIEERSGIVTVIRDLEDFERSVYYFEAVANYQFSNQYRGQLTRRTSRSQKQVTQSGDVLEIDEGIISNTEDVLVTNVTIHVVGPDDDRGVLMRGSNLNPIEFHIEENMAGAQIGRLLYKNGKNIEKSSDIKNLVGQSRKDNLRNNRFMNSKFRRNSTTFLITPSKVNNKKVRRELGEDANTVAFVTPTVLFDEYLQNDSGRNIGSLSNRRGPTWRPMKRMTTESYKLITTTNSPTTTMTLGTHIFNDTDKRSRNDKPMGLRFLIANQQDVTNKITIMDDGTLMTLNGLDREVRDLYRLTIIAEYSKGFISGAGIYQVNIVVDDVNDNPPIFDAITYSGMIYENSPKGTEVILNRPIQVSDADSGVNAKFILSLTGDGKDLFKIEFFNVTTDLSNKSLSLFDSHEQFDIEKNFIDMQMALLNPNKTMTGPHYRIQFIGSKPLDRERNHFYNLNLTAKDSGNLTSSVRLTILIADVNDNAPVFDKIAVFKDAGVEILEYTDDMEIYFVEKMNENERPKEVVEYALPGSPRLVMNNRTSRSRRAGIQKLIFRQPKKIKNPPYFAILEDIPVGATVLKITATDDDTEKNSQVFYEIVSESVISMGKLKGRSIEKSIKFFNTDRISGEIKINHPLQSNIEIILNITAKDIGGLQDFTTIRFKVVDVNDHAPVFKKSFYSFDLQEGEYFDQSVDRIEATDDDYGSNANISFKIQSSEDIPFHISSKSGVLKVDGSLDRELKSQYEFLVIAVDGPLRGNRLSSSVEVEVNILDLNDNAPEFVGYDDILKMGQNNELDETGRKLISEDNVSKLQLGATIPVYKAYLNRNTIPGTFVKQITAIDKDYAGNGNGLVMFSLLHHRMPHLFEIDSRDGIITTISKFNRYNGYEHVNLTVIASDLGSPSKSSTAILLVNLQGEDLFEEDETNLFPHKYYEVEVLENNIYPIDLIKINVTALYTKDLFVWSIVHEYDEDHEAFDLDTKTGVLHVIRSLDREEKDLYRLKIRAERIGREGRTYPTMKYPVAGDRIHGLQENEIRVVVRVADENDNSPIFKGNGRPIVSIIPNTANFGYPVTQMEATDLDSGLNAEIRYKLLNEPSKLFGIDENSGKIRVLAPVGTEKRVYGFDVKATDRKGDHDGRSSIANVFVYVLDENKQVRLVIGGKPVDVEKNIDILTESLSAATGMDVRVRMLEPHLGTEIAATDAYIYAVDPKSNTIVDMEVLQTSMASIDMRNISLSPSSHILELSDFGKIPMRTHYKTSASVSGVELISIILAIIVFIGGMATSLCILCSRYKRKHRQCPDRTGLAYSIARLPSTIGTSAHSKTTTTSAGSPSSKRELREALVRQSARSQVFPGFKPAKAILANYDQRPREYIDVPLPKSLMNSNLLDNENTLHYTQIHSTNLSQPQDNSMQSHHSSGHDSGVGFISSNRDRSNTPSDNLLRLLQNRSSLVAKNHLKCACKGRQEGNACCGGDSSDSYEDSLKSGEIQCSHPRLHAIGNVHHSNSSANHRFRRSYRNHHVRSKRGIRHSFSGVRDDLTQQSPRFLRPRVHSFRNSMTDLEQRLQNLEQSFREPFHLNNSRC